MSHALSVITPLSEGVGGQAIQRLAENMWRNRQMTYIEMLNRFNEEFPNVEIDDYRPFCDELTKGKSGIALWLSNGDSIMYFPKSE